MQMRRFEKVGLTRAQAEQTTELLTETICMNKVKITEQFVSKAALEKVCLSLSIALQPLMQLHVVLLSSLVSR